MKDQLRVMLELQDAMNSRVDSAWRTQGFAWYRAIWVECAELLDHHGWKWWKKQVPDLGQMHLELIDIWHFGMSQLLLENDSIDALILRMQEGLESPAQELSFLDAVEVFTTDTLNSRSFSVAKFAAMMSACGLSFSALYRGYIGKNVLNFFRQDHGYKDGTYVKTWNGREDNEHLSELVQTLDAEIPSFKDDVYHGLQTRYQAATHVSLS